MFKPELVLPPLMSAIVLVGVILYSTRRAIRDSRRLSLELNARAEARVAEYVAKNRAELARLQAEYAVERTTFATGFDLVLILEDGANAEEVYDRAAAFLDGLDEFARASGGTGLKLDPDRSRAEPGVVTLRLIPADPQHVARQREVVVAKSRKIIGVSEVELVAA